MRMMLAPVAGDVDAAGKPDMVVPLHMGKEFHQPGKARRPPDQAAMSPTDIILGALAPSSYSVSKASIR